MWGKSWRGCGDRIKFDRLGGLGGVGFMRRIILTSADVEDTFAFSYKTKVSIEERKWIATSSEHRFLTTNLLQARVSCKMLVHLLAGILWLCHVEI